MKSSELIATLLKAAALSYHTDFVVIGSSATHGTVEDPPVDAALRTPDVDFYSKASLSPVLWEEPMRELGQDSDYHIESGCYVEVVSSTLARFPKGWEERATRKRIGSASINGEDRDVHVTFPEIHDLTVSKVAIHRPKDYEFLEGVVSAGLVDEQTLLERWAIVPRVDAANLKLGQEKIREAFQRKRS